ncbi:hypothetical protein Tco_1244012 [Tanacetum coccineum]
MVVVVLTCRSGGEQEDKKLDHFSLAPKRSLIGYFKWSKMVAHGGICCNVRFYKVLEDFTTYCCWFNNGAASEDLVLLRKIEENKLMSHLGIDIDIPRQYLYSRDLQVVSEPPKGLYTRLNIDQTLFLHIKLSCLNDNFSLNDDEELSLHDDASLDGSLPASNKGDAPAKPPQIITTNTLSNIKLPVLQKDDYDTWAMEMEHYIESSSSKQLRKNKFADEERKERQEHAVNGCSKSHLRRFHGHG